MIEQKKAVETMERMKRIRRETLQQYPFFGELLMDLTLAVAEVDTAATDGTHLMLDPAFADRLTDEELVFIFMHEVLHVVFLHCFRTGGRDFERWNIACDFVVNSNLITSMGKKDYQIDGEPVMHRIGDEEACFYTAEEVYDLLWKKEEESKDGAMPVPLDNHEGWMALQEKGTHALEAAWEQRMLEAVSSCEGTDDIVAAGCLRKYRDSRYRSQLKWKQLLRDFVRMSSTAGEDYGFRPPDRRFADEEFIYPGINPAEGEKLEDIWFCVDKSGSISHRILYLVMAEVDAALTHAKNLKAMLSFFDSGVSDPIPFRGSREFRKIRIPCPTGGTSFHQIFYYANRQRRKFKPRGIIILTDGWAIFPERNPLGNIPVLWVIVDNPAAKPFFGRAVHIDSSLIDPP